MFKTIITNKRELATLAILLAVLFTGLYYAREVFPPLAYALTVGYYLLIIALVFFGPWFFISITMPNTMGRFVNVWFEDAWRALGKDDSFTFQKPGATEDSLVETKSAAELRVGLYLTLAVYAVLVIAGSVVAFAAFGQGINVSQ